MPQSPSRSAPKVFICYRRDDSAGYTLSLYEKLSARFGEDNIFMDIDHIEPGADFVQAIKDAVSSCDVVIAVIGPRWFATSEGNEGRLDDPNDFVRLELSVALSRNVRLIPALVQGASMPTEGQLPDDLKALSRRQAFELSNVRWKHDVDELIGALGTSSRARQGRRPKVLLACAAALISIAVIGITVATWRGRTKQNSPQPTNSTVRTANSTGFTNSIGMEFVWIPPGQFLMGSEKEDEKPPHTVTISSGFFMGKTEVTEEQWEELMGIKKGSSDPIYFYGCANCPVETATWNDAMAFINKLNALNDGYKYELPSEAKWEYACRGRTTRDNPDELDSVAWYANNSGSEYLNATEIWKTDRDHYYDRLGANREKTHEVATTPKANAFGLYDMQGNVYEWCADAANSNYEGAPSDGSARLKGLEGQRVRRGGSWLSPADFVRCGMRVVDTAGRRENDIGFRVAAVAKQ
jgi:formylglycine-generating enzyme required for sulfatase activity